MKCPGLENTLAVRPEEHPCPGCGRWVEIWTDERKTRCTSCGMVVLHPNPMLPEAGDSAFCGENGDRPGELIQLKDQAIQMGISKAALIPSAKIHVNAELSELCSGQPPCENYGKSMNCPPHVKGPESFQHWRDKSPYSIVLRIDVPSDIMFSKERRELMGFLQETLVVLEKYAKAKGYPGTKSFAGGSCKKIWCDAYPNCRVVSEDGICRHPDKARPSMSGFGIDVTRLMESAGWSDQTKEQKRMTGSDDGLWMAGLLLLLR